MLTTAWTSGIPCYYVHYDKKETHNYASETLQNNIKEYLYLLLALFNFYL